MASTASVSTDQAPGPRSTKGERTRATLLQAAKLVFEEGGFLNARISDIAKRANLSHGSFYHYFDSKEQIFREVAAAVDDALGAPLSEIVLAPSQGRTPRELLSEAIREHFERYQAEARIMGLIEEVSRYDEQINALLLERHRQYARQVAESIRELQRRKMADRDLNPDVAAAAIDSMTGRFAELWLVQGAVDCSMDEAVQQVTTLVVNALGIADAPKR